MSKTRTLSIDISYEQLVEPNRATFEITIFGKSDNVKQANEEMVKRIEEVNKALSNKNVESVNTTFAKVSSEKGTVYTETAVDGAQLFPQYRNVIKNGQEIKLYEAGTITQGYSYRVQMSAVSNIPNKKLEKIWEALMKLNDKYPDGFSFEVSYDVSDEDKVKKELKKAAVEAAKTEAEDLAAAAGAKLGRIHSIKYSLSDRQRDMWQQREGVYAAAKATSKPSEFKMPNFEPKPINVSCYVDLVYELV